MLSFQPAAPGWWALWKDAGGLERVPVAGWAMVDYEGFGGMVPEVVAMVAEGDSAVLALAIESEWSGLVFEPGGAVPGGRDGRD
jgi:hypothetical protein